MNRAMKDSGIEWIGKLPLDWKCKRIKYCGLFSKGKIAAKLNNENIGLPYIGATEMASNDNYINFTEECLVDCKKDDILRNHFTNHVYRINFDI
jgi:type I restriction enzyme S subunit